MVTISSTKKDLTNDQGFKMVLVYGAAVGTGSSSSFSVTLADYGISDLLYVDMKYHSTDLSVIEPDTNFTTSVSSGVLTITYGSGTDAKRRVAYIMGI